jgi:hypothetical protein
VQNLVQWHQDAANVNLAVALMRIRFKVYVVVINGQNAPCHRVMATHAIPDLDFLSVFYEPLQPGSEAHS